MNILERLKDPAVLGQMGFAEKLGAALVTAVIGMLVCMVALAAIMYCIKLMHAVMGRKQPAAEAPVPAAPAPSVPQPELADGLSGIATPCAGSVKVLNAAVGAAVRAGDVLLLMESGGSVFQFPAPADGTVEKLCVAEGDSVEASQVLVILKDKEGEANV